jgi:hypothetical protein
VTKKDQIKKMFHGFISKIMIKKIKREKKFGRRAPRTVAGRCRPRGPHVARSEGGAVGATCAICGASGTRGRSAAFGFLARADTKSLASHGGRLRTTRPAGIAAGRTATVRCAPGFGGGSWYKRGGWKYGRVQ